MREYGAIGDGIADDTEVLNAALDEVERNGGGTIYFPPGTYPVGNSARPRLRDNLTIIGKKATLLKAGPNGALFVALSRGRAGYGTGVRNVRINGLRFLGSYPNTRLVCPFALHHASNVVVENCTFEQVQGSRHSFDLNACEDIVIRDSTFLGFYDNEGFQNGECIQVDYSYNGALSYNDAPGSHSGLMSRRITVENCRFLPIRVDGVDYPCPNPFGAHGLKEGARFTDLTFRGNLVVDPIHGPAISDEPNVGHDRGLIHLPTSAHVVIEGNRFVQTKPGMLRVISFSAASYVITTESDPNVFPPIKETLEHPVNCHDLTIRNNAFEGFRATDPNVPAQQVIFLRGLPNGGELRDVEIRGNKFFGLANPDVPGAAAIEAKYVDGLVVADNKFESSGPLLSVDEHSRNITVESTVATGVTGSAAAINVPANDYEITHNMLRGGTPRPEVGISIGIGSPGIVAQNTITGFADPIQTPEVLPDGVVVQERP
ncbi:glycosyl hydrolase family 28-related protein [Actinopolymorpha sp. B11F2]|uniref:glycosyl hydrolase family 28-related protein n=1 Tax=Actinopolymorpha sp. B11F2 TaxID=3160862 RepID=UPI0032E3F9B0